MGTNMDGTEVTPIDADGALAAVDPWHGTVYGYSKRGCRCRPCSEAKRAYAVAYRARNAERERERATRYRAENAETLRVADAAWRANNSGARRERQAAYRAENRQRILARKARWRAENRDLERLRMAEYFRTPEGKAASRASGARRRARERALDCGCVTTAALRSIWGADSGRCAYCGEPGAHFDHVVPLARGGWHCVSNLRVACVSCNQRKGARPLSWLLSVLAAEGVTALVDATAAPTSCEREGQTA